jgi:hypothetical protein
MAAVIPSLWTTLMLVAVSFILESNSTQLSILKTLPVASLGSPRLLILVKT